MDKKVSAKESSAISLNNYAVYLPNLEGEEMVEWLNNEIRKLEKLVGDINSRLSAGGHSSGAMRTANRLLTNADRKLEVYNRELDRITA